MGIRGVAEREAGVTVVTRPRWHSPLVDPRWFGVRQAVLIAGAFVAYFGVRGLTEGAVESANRNAARILDLERSLGVAVELSMQQAVEWSELLVNLGNWVYIWLHWPLVIGTLLGFALWRRGHYFDLRNALFISGAIGLVIYATFPVAPPRLFSPEYVDTVTLRSNSYRIIQPPAFTNLYAAVPSLHFGWNLLVGIAWYRVWRHHWWRWAGVVMPIAMAWAVVVTGNHWVLDVVAGGAVALAGLALQQWRRTLRTRAVSGAEDVRVPSSAAGAAEADADADAEPGGYGYERLDLAKTGRSNAPARDDHSTRSG